MYDKGEAEASIMFNMIMDHVELYNRKMDSLSDTREILEGMMNMDEFKLGMIFGTCFFFILVHSSSEWFERVRARG